jgi:hypothetical protein
MSQRSSGPIGPQADDDWPDDLWPDDDDATGWQADPAAGAAPAGVGPSLPLEWPPGALRTRRVRPAVMAAVIVAATAAGAGVAAVAAHDLASPASGAGSGPSATGPGNGVLGGGVLPAGGAGPGGGGGPVGSIFVIGTVTAVSRTSITISGPGHTITAAITSATHITGKVAGIGGIKTGDHVSAQLTARSGRVTVAAIADPAQAPSGGSLP